MNIKITGDGMASASGRHAADLHHFEGGRRLAGVLAAGAADGQKFSDHGHDHRGVRGRA
jgi:hypothetical protein